MGNAIRGPLLFNNWQTVLTGNYTVVNEAVILVNKTVGAATQITLPASLSVNGRREVRVIDVKGDAATNNITVVPAGSDTINGGSSHVISENYGCAVYIDGGGGKWVLDANASALSATELAYLNGVTAGTSAASKATVTDSSGNLSFTGRLTTTDGVSSGTARVVGGLAYSNTAASTAIASTSAETAFDVTYTIPANTLKAGTLVKVRYQGIATTGIGTDTFAHKLYVGGSGGTAIISASAAQLATNATFNGEAEIICRTSGATGTMVATATYKQSSAEGTMTVKDDILASTTINTTANQAITVTGQWNTSNANSCRLDILRVEIY